MEILEFGDKNKRKLILIHGFQCPYQIWEEYIGHYKNEFHIIVPVMPGHHPQKQEDFSSFLQVSEALEDYYLSRYGKEVYAVFGMSMGGVLAATLWQNGRLHIEKIIFDGSPLVPFKGIVKNVILRFYLNVTRKTRQRDPKTLAQAEKICPPKYMHPFLQVIDGMSDTTIRNYIDGISRFRLRDNLNTGDTKIYYYYGSAFNEMLGKKSARLIVAHFTGSTVTCFKGKGHCENTLFHPDLMMKELDPILIPSSL